MKADLILEGGGVRGIAYAAALGVFEREWAVAWQKVGGTSAGAIVAALVACGYRSADLFAILERTRLTEFCDARMGWARPLNAPIALHDFFWKCGIYKGDRFEDWLDELVGDRLMGDTNLPLTVFTWDARWRESIAINSTTHPEMKVSRAVRMSMSIPFFFRPVKWLDGKTERVCVDGGYGRNYPVDVFDVPGEPRWPTIGFLLKEEEAAPNDCSNAMELGMAMLSGLREAVHREITGANLYRSVPIDGTGVSCIDFRLCEETKYRLIRNGEEAAMRFVKRFDFEEYKRRYRPK